MWKENSNGSNKAVPVSRVVTFSAKNITSCKKVGCYIEVLRETFPSNNADPEKLSF